MCAPGAPPPSVRFPGPFTSVTPRCRVPGRRRRVDGVRDGCGEKGRVSGHPFQVDRGVSEGLLTELTRESTWSE